MDISTKAAIRKDQITSIGGLKGCKASKSVAIDGTTCQPGDIVFLGFRGSLSRVTGLYEGQFVFSDIVPPDAPSADLNVLLAAPKPTPKKAKAVTDVRVNDVQSKR